MKCDICGRKKDVRRFASLFKNRLPYCECRRCFEKAMKTMGLKNKELLEKEWNRGKEIE